MKFHYHTTQHYRAMMVAMSYLQVQSSGVNEILLDAVNRPESEFQSISDLNDVVKDAIQTMKEDNQRLNEESRTCNVVSEDCCNRFTQLKLSMNETNSIVEGTQLNAIVLEQELLALQERIDHLQIVSHDGNFIWKITGVHEKIS